jgi:hypothetical protein
MLCDRESLFTNSTRAPKLTSMFFGLTPDDVIVIVPEATGDVGLVDGGLPPQEARPTARLMGRRRKRARLAITS